MKRIFQLRSCVKLPLTGGGILTTILMEFTRVLRRMCESRIVLKVVNVGIHATLDNSAIRAFYCTPRCQGAMGRRRRALPRVAASGKANSFFETDQ